MDCMGVRTHIEQRKGECNEIKVIHHAKNDRDISWHSTRKRTVMSFPSFPSPSKCFFLHSTISPWICFWKFTHNLSPSLSEIFSASAHLRLSTSVLHRKQELVVANDATGPPGRVFRVEGPAVSQKKKNSALTQKKLAIFEEKKCHKLNMLPITY